MRARPGRSAQRGRAGKKARTKTSNSAGSRAGRGGAGELNGGGPLGSVASSGEAVKWPAAPDEACERPQRSEPTEERSRPSRLLSSTGARPRRASTPAPRKLPSLPHTMARHAGRGRPAETGVDKAGGGTRGYAIFSNARNLVRGSRRRNPPSQGSCRGDADFALCTIPRRTSAIPGHTTSLRLYRSPAPDVRKRGPQTPPRGEGSDAISATRGSRGTTTGSTNRDQRHSNPAGQPEECVMRTFSWLGGLAPGAGR